VDELAIAGIVCVALALVWVAYQIRKLHADLQPLIDSTIVQTLSQV
jgi:cell division protein FtsL